MSSPPTHVRTPSFRLPSFAWSILSNANALINDCIDSDADCLFSMLKCKQESRVQFVWVMHGVIWFPRRILNLHISGEKKRREDKKAKRKEKRKGGFIKARRCRCRSVLGFDLHAFRIHVVHAHGPKLNCSPNKGRIDWQNYGRIDSDCSIS